MADDLKDLPPEEKIKKLKELERKKKQEIAEAQKMLKESEQELTDQQEWERKVPIPQVAADDQEALSESEKEILVVHKGIQKKDKPEEDKPQKKEVSLEETVEQAKEEFPLELIQSDYTAKLSQEPMQNLYQEMVGIKEKAEEKGYISAEESRKVEYLSAAAQKKMEDAEAGLYSLTQRVAEAASITKSVGEGLKRLYQGNTNVYQRY